MRTILTTDASHLIFPTFRKPFIYWKSKKLTASLCVLIAFFMFIVFFFKKNPYHCPFVFVLFIYVLFLYFLSDFCQSKWKFYAKDIAYFFLSSFLLFGLEMKVQMQVKRYDLKSSLTQSFDSDRALLNVCILSPRRDWTIAWTAFVLNIFTNFSSSRSIASRFDIFGLTFTIVFAEFIINSLEIHKKNTFFRLIVAFLATENFDSILDQYFFLFLGVCHSQCLFI